MPSGWSPSRVSYRTVLGGFPLKFPPRINQTNFYFDTACTTHKLNLIKELLPEYTHLHWLSVLWIIKKGNQSCLIMHIPFSVWGAVLPRLPAVCIPPQKIQSCMTPCLEAYSSWSVCQTASVCHSATPISWSSHWYVQCRHNVTISQS